MDSASRILARRITPNITISAMAGVGGGASQAGLASCPVQAPAPWWAAYDGSGGVE